jgi:exoribonuclease R
VKKLIQIAISKTSSPEDLHSLNEIFKLAETLEMVESTFENRINSNKALRGEKPTGVTRTNKQEINQYKKDAEELINQLSKDLSLMENPREIIQAICFGFDSDIAFWKQAVKCAHPEDMPVIEELLSAKIKLHDALTIYLDEGKQVS